MFPDQPSVRGQGPQGVALALLNALREVCRASCGDFAWPTSLDPMSFLDQDLTGQRMLLYDQCLAEKLTLASARHTGPNSALHNLVMSGWETIACLGVCGW